MGCGLIGIQLYQGTRDTKIYGNTIINAGSGAGILFDAKEGVEIYENRIENVWPGMFFGEGIHEENSLIPQSSASVSRNYVTARIPASTVGYDVLGIFFLPVSYGGSRVTDNTFKGFEYGYSSVKIYRTPGWSLPIELKRNNFISNSIQIEDGYNTNGFFKVENNYFSDHTNCNPDPQGYCQKPYSWPPYINKDPRPKATPW